MTMTKNLTPPIGLNVVSECLYTKEKNQANAFLDAVEEGRVDFYAASKETLQKIMQAELLTGRLIQL